MVTHVLFDFDGTLMDTNGLIMEALNEAAVKFRGQPITQTEYDQILGKPLADQMKALDTENWEAMDAYYRTYYRARRDVMTKEFDGIRDMLDALLDMGMEMGIVSNKGTSGIQHGMETFDLGKYFKVAISSDDVKKRKPDPEGIFKALDTIGGKPENTLFVGDSAHDIECGNNAGTQTILVGWTIIDRDRLLRACPDHIVETPDDIVKIVEDLQKYKK